jgi:cytochrome c556
MNKRLFMAGLALVLGAGYSLAAYSQATPETLVKQRQAVMTLKNKYLRGQLHSMAQGKIPYDANVAARNTGYLDALTQMPWDGFASSTANLKSRALPEGYKEPAKFKEAQDRLRGEVGKLVAATKGGDEAAVKTQILAVAKACDGCHEDFRQRR